MLPGGIIRPVGGVYTFGQPRIGLHNFCGAYDRLLAGKTFRFINREDLVPRVPFRGWNYADLGQTIHFDSSGTLGRYVMDHIFRVGVEGEIPGMTDLIEYGRRPGGVLGAEADTQAHTYDGTEEQQAFHRREYMGGACAIQVKTTRQHRA